MDGWGERGDQADGEAVDPAVNRDFFGHAPKHLEGCWCWRRGWPARGRGVRRADSRQHPGQELRVFQDRIVLKNGFGPVLVVFQKMFERIQEGDARRFKRLEARPSIAGFQQGLRGAAQLRLARRRRQRPQPTADRESITKPEGSGTATTEILSSRMPPLLGPGLKERNSRRVSASEAVKVVV